MPTDNVSAREERAAHWAVRVNSGAMSQDEEAQLDAWTNADSRNLGAFARAMAAHSYFDRAAALGIPHPPAGLMEPRPASDAPGIDRLDGHRQGMWSDRPISRRQWIGGGWGAAAAVLVAVVGLKRWLGTETIAAPMGNVQRAALRDGSAVTLNSSAEINVAFRQELRAVSLVAGEANFDIARDAARPFIVDAGPVQIRVVGTSFLVRMTEPDSVSVTVREGVVDVRHGDTAPVRLLAGDRLTFARQGMKRERLTMADVDRIGLWQRGEMDLTGMTLADAAREFARYSDMHIVITDPAVAAMQVAGVYSTSDPAGFARAVALAQGLDMTVSPDRIALFR